MKVKVIENGQEKLIDASYIIVDNISLHDLIARIDKIETRLINTINKFNKHEDNLVKAVKEL